MFLELQEEKEFLVLAQVKASVKSLPDLKSVGCFTIILSLYFCPCALGANLMPSHLLTQRDNIFCYKIWTSD